MDKFSTLWHVKIPPEVVANGHNERMTTQIRLTPMTSKTRSP